MLTINIYAEYVPRRDKYEIHFTKYDPNISGRLVANPIKFGVFPEGVSAEPCLSLTYEEVQNLMDQFWDIGLRPTKFPKNKKKMSKSEIEKFLSDLRELI